MTMTLMVLIFVLVWCQVKLEPYQWEEEINVSQAVNFLGNFNKSGTLSDYFLARQVYERNEAIRICN